MTGFPAVEAWYAACADDASLAVWAGDWSVCFAIASGDNRSAFNFTAGRLTPSTTAPAFTVRAPATVWDKFLQPVPPRHHHGLFAMHYRVPGFAIESDTQTFMQYVHVVRRVLEVGKWLALGRALPVPVTLAPPGGPRPIPPVTAGYVPVTALGQTYQVYYEAAGTGRDILCMHTAGSDCRQFHGLMADPRITAEHRLVAFDLPWHGKSLPPEGAIPGSWWLNTELYVALIMSFAEAAGLNKPVALGASMSGEICPRSVPARCAANSSAS